MHRLHRLKYAIHTPAQTSFISFCFILYYFFMPTDNRIKPKTKQKIQNNINKKKKNMRQPQRFLFSLNLFIFYTAYI